MRKRYNLFKSITNGLIRTRCAAQLSFLTTVPFSCCAVAVDILQQRAAEDVDQLVKVVEMTAGDLLGVDEGGRDLQNGALGDLLKGKHDALIVSRDGLVIIPYALNDLLGGDRPVERHVLVVAGIDVFGLCIHL